MGESCVLIKQTDLDEIKKNHPDTKLLEKIKNLESENYNLRKELITAKSEISSLKANPIVKIDPLKIEISLLEVYAEKNYYGRYNSYSNNKYSLISPVNFSLDGKLRKQIEVIIKLAQERLIRDFEYYKEANIVTMKAAIKNEIANMGYWERRKYLKEYRK